MKGFIIGLVTAWLIVCSQASSTTEDLMMRTAYCACRCCEKNKECYRHPDIPAMFKCSESNCNEKFCDAWDNAKCAKSCFCENCKDKIDKDDYRCLSHTGVPDNCDCDKHKTNCDHVQNNAKEMNEGMKTMAKHAENIHCVMPCFCKNCKDSLPPEMYGDCMMGKPPGEECQCDGIGCPSQEVLDGLKKVREMRARNPGNSSSYKFAEEIDNMMSPEEAKKLKCNMQCYCDACGNSNEKIYDNCQKMLPKPRVEDCKCNKDDIKCPTDDVDQHCKLYCFCKGCLNDPRMGEKFIDSCNAMLKRKQDCLCADEEDCSVLEKIPMPSDPVKKKPKKGKLKKKNTDKDEL